MNNHQPYRPYQPPTPGKAPLWARLVGFVRSHRVVSFAVVGVLFSIALGLGVYALINRQPSQPQAAKPKPPAPARTYYAPLTGQKVGDEAATTKPITAIMIENSPSARPQSGLKDAEVVYEAIAEGGITRFLALYQQHKPELVGPVRSLRMYYVDWLAPYNAGVAHVGGSAHALKEIRSGAYRDLDQFFNESSYWRASDRRAPHNVYTSFAKLDALTASKNYKQSNPTPLARATTKKAAQPGATTITVTMSGPLYNSSWQYDAGANSYTRSQGGEPHTDREKGQISAQVVVVLKMDMNKIMEDGVREDYKTTGSGDAVVFMNGQAHEVTWAKGGRKAQLTFKDKNGAPFKLARGTTWITAVPANQGGGVSWK